MMLGPRSFSFCSTPTPLPFSNLLLLCGEWLCQDDLLMDKLDWALGEQLGGLSSGNEQVEASYGRNGKCPR